MAVAYRSSGTTAAVTGTSITVNAPAGAVAGDLLLVMIGAMSGAFPTTVTSSGWISTGCSTNGVAFYKIMAAGETSWTFTLGSSQTVGAIIAAYSGVDPNNPFIASTANIGIQSPAFAQNTARTSATVIVGLGFYDSTGSTQTVSSGTSRQNIVANNKAFGLADTTWTPSAGVSSQIGWAAGGSGMVQALVLNGDATVASGGTADTSQTRTISTSNSTATMAGTPPDETAPGDLMIATMVVNSNLTVSTPSGWTLVDTDNAVANANGVTAVWYRRATGADTRAGRLASPTNYNFGTIISTGSTAMLTIRRYTGAGSNSRAPVGASARSTYTGAGTWGFPSVTAPAGPRALLLLTGQNDNSGLAGDTVTGRTNDWDQSVNVITTRWLHTHSWLDALTTAGATSAFAHSTSAGPNWGSDYAIVLMGPNTAPNTPVDTGPASGASLDRTANQTFTWTFSDPDVGDTQSAASFEYRLVGAGSWTVIATTTAQTVTINGGTLAAGNYERRISTTDASGVTGPYSATVPFTMVSPPAAPTITAPANGSTVTGTTTVAWTAASQEAYQVRKVADLAGSPDTGTVYSDTGTVVSTSDRSYLQTFPTNSRFEHVQVRVRLSGIWSTWASNRVQVSFTPPNTPTATVTSLAATARISVSASRAGGGITVASYSVDRAVAGSGVWVRKATGLAPTATWYDEFVVPGKSYDYRVIDLGVNGVESA